MPEPLKLPFTTSHAFLIGINEYEHISSLGTAVKDATDIAELLEDESKHGYKTHLLTDASKKEMEAFFQKMTETVEADDRVIFYYAGHGIAVDSVGDPEGYLVPADAEPDNTDSLVPMKMLHETLRNLPCKHGLLVLDCCFAGAFKWSTGFRAINWGASEVLYAERFWRFVEHPAWQVITSSAHDQKAADVLDKQALGLRDNDEETKDKNSPFAWAFKQAIDLHSKADVAGFKRSDGVITATELYIYLREIVETATLTEYKRQSPSLFTLGKHDSKGEYIFLNPGHKLNLPEAPDTNPYKGLSPYEATDTDSQSFFGRTEAINKMAEKLEKSSILVVSAPSGQGKSSTVKAGLFPLIQKEHDPPPVILRPGDRLSQDWNKLSEIDVSKRQVILIDQYEEMFNLEVAEQTFFEEKLLDLMKKAEKMKDAKFRLILTIRSDFEWQLNTSDFGKSFWKEENIRNFLYRLPPMSQEELREIMVKPAWTVAYEFESEELINQILEEINHSPGALPLLSFTLHKLYEKRDRDKRLLTKKAYKEDLGGVNGALSKHADALYEKMPSDKHKDFMRKLMIRMVRLNDGSYSRRRVYLNTSSSIAKKGFIDELDYPDHLDAIKDKVLKILEDALLIIRDKDKFGLYVEPMHDSLLNFWPRCLQWIQEFGRENLVLQRQLWQAVMEHHQWKKPIYATADGRKPKRPLWDNNPKLQQVQIAVTDPKDEWLFKKGRAEKSISSIAYLLWDRKPSTEQMAEMEAWNWYFQTENAVDRYQKIQDQMDHWLNEEEMAFVKKSFEEQRSELERLIADKNAALKAKEKAEELAHNMGLQTVAFKQKYQRRSLRDLLLIQQGLKPSLHLIMVGIDKYQDPIPSLKSGVKDINNLAPLFQAQEGKLYEKVFYHPLLDADATKQNILEKVKQVRSEVNEFDYVILYMIGQATIIPEREVVGGKEGAFLTYQTESKKSIGQDFADLEKIWSTELFAELIPFQSVVILLLDFCHGAEFLQPLSEANQSTDIEALTNSIFAISGCSPGQFSYESPEGGYFSLAFQNCFKNKEADLDANGVIYLDEILQYTTQYVELASLYQQQPIAVVPSTLSNIPLIQLGDDFALPKKEMALSGHIEDDHVIESIINNLIDDDMKKRLKAEGFHNILLENKSTR